jgi:hypothetical protein
MRALFLDLASHPSTSSGQAQGLLACVTGERVTALEAVDHRVGDHELIPLFERVLSTASWGSKDLTHVACVIGPGGFTSLRVAVAFANTLAHELTIPAAGIHLSDLYAARITPHPPLGCARGNLSHPPSLLRSFGRAGWEREQGEASFLWLHSTKKYELFVRGFGEFVKFWPEATHVSVEGFLEKISPSPGASRHPLPEGEGARRALVFCGELIPEHEALFKDKLIPVALQPLVDVLPAFLARQNFAQKLLEPWYGRGG